MGADIHAHIEIKLDGKWEHWHAPKILRWYGLFARMAGVRSYEESDQKYPVRGLPDDLSVPTRWAYELEKADSHTESWLTWQEFAELQKWVESEHPEYRQPGHGWHTVIGYLNGNNYEPTGRVSDIRLVFWFDN